MAVKTLLGILDEETGLIQGFDGETYTQQELELIEQNLANNRTYSLIDKSNVDSDSTYRLVMETVIDNIRCFFEFDCVKDKSIDINSTITEHPLVNGDTIADHMYKEPANMTITGSFSLNGKQRYSYGGGPDRLANIQDLFERINKEGITSKLITMAGTDSATSRFKIRENMALISINWREHLNSVDFVFTFREVITATVQEVEYDENIIDPNLPALTDASSLDFTDVLLDWNSVDAVVFQEAERIEAITPEFLQYAVDNANIIGGTTVGLAAGVAAGLLVLKVIALACGTIPVAGWIASAALVVAGAIIGAILALFQGIRNAKARKEYGMKQWKLYKDDRKSQQEVKDFANYIGNIHTNLEYLNDIIQVYGITSNENQECLTFIDDKYYIFRFMKNNVNNHWCLTCLDMEDNEVGPGCTDCNEGALPDISACKSGKELFRTEGGGFYVFLLNKMTVALKNNGASAEEIEAANSDLRNYYILVSQTNLSEFNELLKDIVVDAMKR